MLTARRLVLSIVLGTAMISVPTTAKANYLVDAKMEASCKGFDGLQFTATSLQPNTKYTAVITINSVCPNSSTPTIKTVSVNFVTPSTITGTPGGAVFTSSDYIQVGNPACVAGPNPNTYCEVPNLAINPGLDYSPVLGIYDPLSLNPGNPITNNGCQVNATAILTSDPSKVLTVNVAGATAPARQTVSCTCPPDSTGATSQLIDNLAAAGPNNFAILGLGGASSLVNVTYSGVTGNVGEGNPGTLQESSSNVTGNLIVGSTVNTSSVHGSHGSIVIEDSVLSAALSNADLAAAYFATLPSTPSVQSQFPSNGLVTGALTINLIPGVQNVVNLSSFDLNNGSRTLTFKGSAGTSLIINDSGTFNLDSGTIAVSGGMGPLDVLYNITSPTAMVYTSAPTTAVGVLLAPNNNTTMANTNFTGEVISGYQRTIALMSSNVINPCALQQTCNGGWGDGSWGNGGWSIGSWNNGSWGNSSWGNGNWGNGNWGNSNSGSTGGWSW